MAKEQFFDALETRDPAAREAALFAALPAQVAWAKEEAPAHAARLAEVTPAEVRDRAALAKLPVLRKSEVARLQSENPPFGGLNGKAPGNVGRIFSSPGPIYELDDSESDYARFARALFAAGFRPGMVVHNSLAYHLTPGGWMLDGGARALGCSVIAGGVGNTEQQLAAIQQVRPQGFAGTPDYLKTLLDKAVETGHDASSIRHAMVSGGALFPSLRAEYRQRGVACFQCYATAELGLIAYETAADDGTPNAGMVLDETLILEIVRPGTGDPLPAGEVGEVVVTNFNRAYPMIRLGTGDLSAVVSEPSPCGRTNQRIKGWMGRADQTTKVKGMFVQPGQIAEVLARHPEVTKGRLEVSRKDEQDVMTLTCESERQDPALAGALGESLQQVTKMKGEVALAPPGSLPNDGKVIDDQRSYE